MCCIFQPAFGCCALQTLVEIFIFNVFELKMRKKRNLQKNLAKKYFDQRTHACPCVGMVENYEKYDAFFMIFECFSLFLTMQTHVQACVRWLKYTTQARFKPET